MEDKWHIYADGDHLYFHRSWTGVCIYDVSINQMGDVVELTHFTVNRNPEEYGETDDAFDVKMLDFLVNVLLLHVPAEFPSKADDPSMAALETWSSVGIAGSQT